MNLVYMAVKNNSDEIVREYSFSTEYKVELKEKMLYVTDNVDFIENFYGKGINISGIVGKNGVGKSHTLKLIAEHIYSKLEEIAFFVIKQKNELINYVSNDNSQKFSIEMTKKNKSIFREKIDIKNPYISILFSNSIENKFIIPETKDSCLFDFTTTAILKRKSLNSMMQDDMNNQVKFVTTNLKNNTFLKQLIPNYVVFEVKKPISDDEIIILYSKGSIEYNQFLNLNNLNLNIDNSIIEVLNIAFYEYIVKEYNIAALQHIYTVTHRKNFSNINDYISNLKSHNTNNNKIFELLEKHISIISNINLRNKEINDSQFSLNIVKNAKFFEFYEENIVSTFYENFFVLRWENVSSGQISFLNLFGRINSVKEQYTENKMIMPKSGIMLIDEIDLGLHPDWQRMWIKNCPSIIKKILEVEDIHIIFTTHSPIILSDLNHEDILFIKENCILDNIDFETFGQNIQTLYSDGFFLSQTIGEYSNYVISKLIKILTFFEVRISESEDVSLSEDQEDSDLINYLFEIYGIGKNESIKKWVEKSNQTEIDDINRKAFLFQAAKFLETAGNEIDYIQILSKIKKYIKIVGEEFIRGYLFRKFVEIENLFNNTKLQNLCKNIDEMSNDELKKIMKKIEYNLYKE